MRCTWEHQCNPRRLKTLKKKKSIKTVVFNRGGLGYQDHPGRIFTIQILIFYYHVSTT